MLMNGFIKRMKDAKVCDRIALLAEDGLVPFYDSLGFDDLGESDATFGGIRWKDMVITQTRSALMPQLTLTRCTISRPRRQHRARINYGSICHGVSGTSDTHRI